MAEFVGAAHAAFEGLYAALPAEWPGEVPADVTYRVATTRGADGNDIALHIFRPAGAIGPLPGVVYLHGGGMTILDTDNQGPPAVEPRPGGGRADRGRRGLQERLDPRRAEPVPGRP